MRRLFLSTVFAVTLLSSAVFASPETFTLDPSHTHIDWQVTHFGFSHPTGKFSDTTGTLVLDEVNPANSKITVDISPSSVLTGVPKLDEHIKSKDFLNVVAFPKAKFVSDKVELTGKETAKVTGDLTLLGVTKPVVLDVTLNKLGVNPMSQKKTVGFTATTTIKRSDFGVSAYVPNISDEVKISIESEANLAEAAPVAAPIAPNSPAPAPAPAKATTATTPSPISVPAAAVAPAKPIAQ